MSAGTGGLPPRRVDQVRQPGTPALQPGSGQIVRARYVIVTGENGGIFIYGGQGPGGLFASDTLATADPFGNPVNPGTWVYGANGSAIGIATILNQPALLMIPNSVTQSTEDATAFAESGNGGAANEYQYMILSSGKSNANDDAAIQLFSESADGTIAAKAIVEFGGVIAGTFSRLGYEPGPAWTVVPLQNGWAEHLPNAGLSYRQVFSNLYEVTGVIDGGSATGTQVGTLPRAPISQQGILAVSTAFAAAYLICDTSGNLTMNAASIAHVFVVNGFIRLT